MRGICSNERAAITHQRLNAWSLSLSLSGPLVSRDTSVYARISEGSRRIWTVKLLFIICNLADNCRWRKWGDRKWGKKRMSTFRQSWWSKVFFTNCISEWEWWWHSPFLLIAWFIFLESWHMTNLISYSGEFSIITVHVKWRINGHRRTISVRLIMVVEC